jgi:hypothetical protein
MIGAPLSHDMVQVSNAFSARARASEARKVSADRRQGTRGHLRMRRENSPLTGAAVEFIGKESFDTSVVVRVRLLERAGEYPEGATLYVGVEEFIDGDD